MLHVRLMHITPSNLSDQLAGFAKRERGVDLGLCTYSLPPMRPIDGVRPTRTCGVCPTIVIIDNGTAKESNHEDKPTLTSGYPRRGPGPGVKCVLYHAMLSLRCEGVYSTYKHSIRH